MLGYPAGDLAQLEIGTALCFELSCHPVNCIIKVVLATKMKSLDQLRYAEVASQNHLLYVIHGYLTVHEGSGTESRI